MKGKFILVIGPSGSGKGTLINHIRPLFPELQYPKSSTTRSMRANEKHGEHYYFLSREEFKSRIESGDFLEWAEYGGHFYGTLASEVMPLLDAGKTALKELEVQGVRQLQKKIPKEELAIIFVNAGSWSEMETRIRARAPISETELEKRRERYQDEMNFMSEADFVIENHSGQIDVAKKHFTEVVSSLIAG